MRNVKKGLLAIVVALAACETGVPNGVGWARGSLDAPVGPIISSDPGDASLVHPKGVCRTPCRVDYAMAVEVTVGKEGYKPIQLLIPVGAGNHTVTLEAVGRSQPVEEVGLPEL